MSVFGQVIPFRARRESAPVPAARVHRSLSAALADAGLAEAPPLSELSVDPEAGVVADTLFLFPDEPLPADEPAVPSVRARTARVATVAPVSEPVPYATVAPIPQAVSPAPAAIPAEPPLPRVIALATRHPPSVASYPWINSARQRRRKTRASDMASWLVTIVIVGGMIGVAATYLTGPRPNSEPVAQR
jgi:hypothetical protein